MSIRRELDLLSMSVGNLSKLTFGDRVYIDKSLVDRIYQLEFDLKDLELRMSIWMDRVKDLERMVYGKEKVGT